MSSLTLPQARIPLGWVQIQGKRTPVEIDMEWMRSLLELVKRTGGVTGYDDLADLLQQVSIAPPAADVIAHNDLTPPHIDVLRDEPQDGARLSALESELGRLMVQLRGLQLGVAA